MYSREPRFLKRGTAQRGRDRVPSLELRTAAVHTRSMGPVRRTINLICALALTVASAAWLAYPLLSGERFVLGWRPGAAAILLFVGLYWLWADFINADPRPED